MTIIISISTRESTITSFDAELALYVSGEGAGYVGGGLDCWGKNEEGGEGMGIVRHDVDTKKLLEWTVDITKGKLAETQGSAMDADKIAEFMKKVHETLFELAQKEK